MSARRAAVIGTPIAHSRSPQLHLAAYAALGLSGWSYERRECDEEGVPALLASFGPDWVGLSVTMPAKVAALTVAQVRTPRAEAVGAANTLVRTPDGWLADCTDVDGVLGALGAASFSAASFSAASFSAASLSGARAVILGAGGTARAAVVALATAGVDAIDLVVRDRARAAATVHCAETAGLRTTVLPFEQAAVAAACRSAAVVISTVPAAAAAPWAQTLATVSTVLDVIYDPWPTPLATAVLAAGGRLASGLDMLLHQAFGQVELFTGLPAPRAAMAAALR